MTVKVTKLADMYEGYLHRAAGAKLANPGAARQAFLNEFRHRLGLCDRAGNDYHDKVGNRVLRECADEQLRFTSDDFSIREMMEGIVGPGYSQFLQSAEAFVAWRNNNFAANKRYADDPRALLEGYGQTLLEAGGVGSPVGPSAFADINAWTAANSGLLERRILEQFVNPEFIGDTICPDEQTRIAEGQKVIGVANIADFPEERQPGMPHFRTTLQPRYVTLPRTADRALAIDVTFEAAFFDLTGQVLETAAAVGKRVALSKELRKIDAVIGVDASTGLSTGRNAFNYKGTAYAQFSGTESLPIPKNSQSNPLTDGNFDTIKASWLLLKRMRDPETGTRIQVNADTILTGLEGYVTANLIVNAIDVQRRTAGALTQATANTLVVQNTPNNPASIGGPLGIRRVLTSSLLEQRMLDTDGLALSAANAAKYFWHLEAGTSHKNMVNFPLTVQQMPMASSYEMTDRKIVQTTFVSERSTPSVWSIWHILRNTN